MDQQHWHHQRVLEMETLRSPYRPTGFESTFKQDPWVISHAQESEKQRKIIGKKFF